MNAAALIVGAGGLGGPVAFALAATGAPRLVVCDDDVVELSNLQRQIQFATADVGRPKVEALADALARRGYPRDRFTGVRTRFTTTTGARLIASAAIPATPAAPAIVIDGSDNFATKFAVNDACVAAGVPFAIGGVLRYRGHVLAVRPGDTGCYRCLFEGPPDTDHTDDGDDPASCAGAGVLGAAVAVIAGELARAAIALASADSDAACHLRAYDDLSTVAPPRLITFRPRPGCPACATAPAPRPTATEAP